MANDFGLRNKKNFCLTDFNKIKSGINKKDLSNINPKFACLFDLVDKDQNEVLSRDELINLQEELKLKDKNSDGEISIEELSKLKNNNDEEIGKKNAKTLIDLFNQITEMMISAGVENVTRGEDGTEIITYTDATQEVIYNGNIREVTVEKDNIKTTTFYNENNLIVKEVLTEDNNDEQIITIKNYNEDGSIKDKTIQTLLNDELYQTEFTNFVDGKENKTIINHQNNITINYVDGNIQSYINSGVQETYYDEYGRKEVFYEEGKTITKYFNTENILYSISESSVLEDGSNQKVICQLQANGDQLITTYINGKAQNQVRKIGEDSYYFVEYDNEGNTLDVVVQFGETPAQIAQKFNVSLEDLLAVNEGIWFGSKNNPMFQVGAEIKIPRKVEAGAEVLTTRNSAEVEIEKYNNYINEQALEAELAAMQAECDRINGLYRELQNRKNQRRADAAPVIEDIQNHFTTSPGLYSRNYDYKDGHVEAITEGITTDNVVEVLECLPDLVESFNKRDNDWEDSDDDNVIKCRHIFNCLIQRAKAAGVPESTLNNYKNTQKTRASYSDMFGDLCALINTYEWLMIAEDIAKAQNAELTEDDRRLLKTMYEKQISSAEEAFEAQIRSDGWCGNLADSWAECFWDSDNTEWDVKDDIDEAKAWCKELSACTTNEEFNAKFKEIFGLDFDPVHFQAYKMRAQRLTQINGLNNEIEIYDKLIGTENVQIYNNTDQCANRDKIGVFERIKGDYYLDANDYLRESDLNTIDQLIEYFGGFEAVRERAKTESSAIYIYGDEAASKWTKTSPQILDMLKIMCEAERQELKTQRKNLLKGSSYEICLRDFNEAGEALFGSKNDIMRRVIEYNQSQQEGTAYIKGGLKIGIAVASLLTSVATGGNSVVVGMSTILALSAPSVIEMSDAMSSINAREVCHEEGFVEYIKFSSDQVDWDAVFRETAMAVTSMVGGSVVGVLSAELCTTLRLLLTTAGDVGVGTASELLFTGQVTVDGFVYNVIFSIIGNGIAVRSATKSSASVEADNVKVGDLDATKTSDQTVRPTADADLDATAIPDQTSRPTADAADATAISDQTARPTAETDNAKVVGDDGTKTTYNTDTQSANRTQMKNDIESLLSSKKKEKTELTSAEVKQITDYIDQIDNIADLNRLNNELMGVEMGRQTRQNLEVQMNRRGHEIINQNQTHQLQEPANKPVVDDVKDPDHQKIDEICSRTKNAKTSTDYINILEELEQLPESIYRDKKIAEVIIAKQQFEQKPNIEITEASRIAAEGPATEAHFWKDSKASKFYSSLTREQKIIVDTYGISHDDIFSMHGILRLKLSKYDTPYSIEGRYLQTKSRFENGQLDYDYYIRTSGPEFETMYNCQESLRNAAACDKKLVIITGRAGGGKSTVARGLGLEDNFYFPDADDLKAFLPGYKEFGAGYVHDLSVRLNTEFTNIAFSEGRNVVFQTTGWSGYVDTIIAYARAKGYTDITLVHVDVSTKNSIIRSKSRAEATGRNVDFGRIENGIYVDGIVLHCHKNQADNIRAVILIDNNGTGPEIIGSYSL